MIQIKNLFLKNNLPLLNYEIDQNKKIGIYSINLSLTQNLLLYISGIKKTNNIFYNNNLVYENKNFFNDRIYLNCNKKITNTLVSTTIANTLMKKYNIICNNDNLKEHIKQLQIRSEGKLKLNYSFSSEGIKLINNAITLSIYKYPILLNPLENISSNKKINYLINNYQTKSFIMGIEKINYYENIFDELLFITNNNYYILKKDDHIFISYQTQLSNINLFENKQINYNNKIVIYKNLSVDEIKQLNKLSIDYKEITLFQIGEYL